jgi:hypothetical protein
LWNGFLSRANCCAARCWNALFVIRAAVRSARGKGHQVFVLTVTYPGGRTRQISIRRERVAEIRRWLANYQELKEAIEAICELNHDLLRPQASVSKGGRKKRD